MGFKTAIIQFPGSNCERETQVSALSSGLDAHIIRWNCSEEEFHSFDAYILPGGFSFQDRIRAGAISAKLPIISALLKANQKRKPILGICNGCQILAETGIVPDLKNNQEVELALSPNRIQDQRIGFICDWVYVKVQNPEKNVFTKRLSNDAVYPIPINHGEGCFILSDEVKEHLSSATTLNYCSQDGQIDSIFPVNPNGSDYNIAGIGNQYGNAFAMMPHPERATFTKQVPFWVQDRKDTPEGPWFALFLSLYDTLSTQ